MKIGLLAKPVKSRYTLCLAIPSTALSPIPFVVRQCGMMATSTEIKKSKNILSLPNEILMIILGLLDGADLVRCAQLSRRFNELAESDNLWAGIVASLHLNSPAPYRSFKELYAALHNHLWLHGHVWHGDRRFTGYLLIARYSSITGAIEIYNLLANNDSLGTSTSPEKPWSIDSSVLIANFQPNIRFWEEPILALAKETPFNERHEIQPLPRRGQGSIACSLSRTFVIPPERQDRSMSLWPPITIPSTERTRNSSIQSFCGVGHQPDSAKFAAKTLFRLRKWIVFNEATNMPFGRTSRQPKTRDDVENFSALDSELYTPDIAHPLRGLWVGDYNVHGCEFVLFHQPTSKRLEGIKITGDINVPRGEYTFIVNNLLDPLRIAHEKEWPGAVVVRAEGQIAASQFVDKKFICSEMIIINQDEVAFYWRFSEEYGHISRFKRLEINRLIYSDKAIMFPLSVNCDR